MITELLLNKSRDTWIEEGSKDLFTRAQEKYSDIKDKLQTRNLSQDLLRELSSIVGKAEKKLVR